MRQPDMPLAYLAECSPAALKNFMLARMNHAANIRKEIKEMTDELFRAEVEAAIAEWIAAHREKIPAAQAQRRLDFAA